MSDDWEYSFQPLDSPGAIHPPSICEHCNKETGQPIYVQKFMDKGIRRTFLFCSDSCRLDFYLNRLRECGT